MKTYLSKSSALVKTTTTGTLLLLSVLAITIITIDKNYTQIGGALISIIILGIVFYFYANSLNKVILHSDNIVLKKIVGEISIPISEIKRVSQLEYSNLTMTYGSKGVFGFIGNTMDNSISLVKDRKKMVILETTDKRYLFSTEKPMELVDEINVLLNSVYTTFRN